MRQGADPLVLVVVGVAGALAEERREVAGDVQRLVGVESAGEDADHAHAPDVRVAGGLHDLGHQRARRVTRRACRRLAPAGVNTSGGVCSGGDGKPRTIRSSSSVQPTPVAGADRHHREERRARDGLLQVGDQHVLLDLLAAEVAVHQRLVLGLLDDPLDQLAPPFALEVTGQQPLERGDLGAVADREVERQHLVAVRRLRLREDPVVVGTRVVELGHDDRARHLHLGALAPDLAGRLVDALVGGDHEQGAVGRPQPGAQLPDEVGVAGGVDQVDLGVAVDQRGRRRGTSTAGGCARSPRSRRPWCRPRPTRPGEWRRTTPATSRPGWSCPKSSARPGRRCVSGRAVTPRGRGWLPSVSACRPWVPSRRVVLGPILDPFGRRAPVVVSARWPRSAAGPSASARCRPRSTRCSRTPAPRGRRQGSSPGGAGRGRGTTRPARGARDRP